MIDNYVEEISRRLVTSRRRRTRILQDIREHLDDAAARLVLDGIDRQTAEARAIQAFGPAPRLASELNGHGAASLLRRTPLTMAASGCAVVGGLFLATITQPRPSIAASADVVQQVAFFAAVLGLQFALVAGLRALARVGARWHTTPSVADHDLIRRASFVFVAGLAVATGGWTIALAMAMLGQPDTSVPLLVAGIAVMNGATIIACVTACHRSGLANDDLYSSPSDSAGGLVLGAPERLLRRIGRWPRTWCACMALVATLAAMSHAETSVQGSLMWGTIQAAAVIAGFVFLGPTLELRAPLSGPAVAD